MMPETTSPVKLTQFSRAAGCGCKIAPAILQEMLATTISQPSYPALITGNAGNEDAAIYSWNETEAVISTTDFFMPVVDDAFDFGCIAAANAISDVYAMGGSPITAIAILGWPVEKLPGALAAEVLEGARETCRQAGIPLAGGHSVDSAEPFFGLAVTGKIKIANIKKNNGAQNGDVIFLTKPIGTGILSTAQKRGLISTEHAALMTTQMKKLNSCGEWLGSLTEVTSMTDVTGFGLVGHLVEMAEGSGLSATLNYSDLPVADGAREYLSLKAVPDATFRNWNAYSKKIQFEKGVNVMEAFSVLPDPQTNGGLMFSVSAEGADNFQEKWKEKFPGETLWQIGVFHSPGEYKLIYVK
ncbi:MAG: selenide, water dikinase SelD [Ferruginibacter sp.]